ncbi:MAG: entericidin A/B family lipoprotein [Nitrosomonas sp.]|nr:entericidin A/B family lipoprotein [Nitrosomonas sp.]
MKMFSIMMLLISAFYVSACNTMAGVGKDIQKGGEAIEETAL